MNEQGEHDEADEHDDSPDTDDVLEPGEPTEGRPRRARTGKPRPPRPLLDEATLLARLDRAFEARRPLLESGTTSAFRLLHGFVEGVPGLALDVLGHTLVAFDHTTPRGSGRLVQKATERARAFVPGLTAVLWKVRKSPDRVARCGRVVWGDEAALATTVEEEGVKYAVDLRLGHDASFYPDTRELRRLLRAESQGARVLNAFACSGSLGVAAAVGGAVRVLQLDKSSASLDLARRSTSANRLPMRRGDFRAGDVFTVAAELRKTGELFDWVVVDPPVCSASPKGTVDLEGDAGRLVDKLRPLLGDGGRMALVVNALFVPGEAVMKLVRELEGAGYASLDRVVGVPADCTGTEATREGAWPVDPAPFAHPTKIVVLRFRRKDGRKAQAPAAEG